MTFKEYFNKLLIPLKDTSKNFVSLFISIANSFDSCKIFAHKILNNYFLKDSKDIEGFAKERGISRIQNEKEVAYKNRVIKAYSFLKYSSTLEGIKSLITQITNKKFIIRELYSEDWILNNDNELLGDTTILGGDVSSYYFVVEFDKLLIEEKTYLEEIIELYKPAHVGFHINAIILDDWILGEESELLGKNTYLE